MKYQLRIKDNSLLIYRFFFFILLLTSNLFLNVKAIASASPTESIRELPVQEGGRIKPFDTLAREILSLIYGKSSYEGKPAYEVVMTWLLTPEEWESKNIVEINHSGVKEALKLDKMKRYFTVKEIFQSDRLSLLMQDLNSKRESKEKLDAYFQALQRIENQISTFREFATGHMLSVVPPQQDGQDSKWLSVPELEGESKTLFLEVTKAFIAGLGAEVNPQNNSEAALNAKADLEKSMIMFVDHAKNQNQNLYPKMGDIKLEVHYNSLHPFRWAWIFYFFAFVLMIVVLSLKKEKLIKAVWIFTILGFLFHSYGFGLRMYLTERPPVSNMFETVVWVSWGAIIFSLIIERIYKLKITLLAGPIVATFCLMLSDMAPSILDPTLRPLEPVLRSNFWLTIHVLTITISYSAFFLAFCLGDVGLYYHLRGEQHWKDRLNIITQGIYRSIQIGVVLLAAGIILGGVWADYSWGRFWGWDPKETWALIALLGYLAILHGRLVGLIKQFGMVVSSVISFSLVIMAWYGVNYVLGAGLHSYGFGAGGVEYVSAFILIHIVYVVTVAIIRNGRLKTKS